MSDTEKTPITYYGGKQRMLKYILPLIPDHITYVEPFFGGGAVFFAKHPSKVEFINDLNREVINFFDQSKTNFKALKQMIDNTSCYSRVIHKKSGIIYDNPDCFSPLERAWAFWMQSNFSFASRIRGGWGYGIRSKSTALKFKRKRLNFKQHIEKRLFGVYVESKNALKLIKDTDTEETFFYIDPPYVGSDQGHYSGYSESDFISLLELLTEIKGKFLLSHYQNPKLNGFVRKSNWNYKEIEQQLCVVSGSLRSGRKKTECLVSNYEIIKKQE